jgi:hypothetical protein
MTQQGIGKVLQQIQDFEFVVKPGHSAEEFGSANCSRKQKAEESGNVYPVRAL